MRASPVGTSSGHRFITEKRPDSPLPAYYGHLDKTEEAVGEEFRLLWNDKVNHVFASLPYGTCCTDYLPPIQSGGLFATVDHPFMVVHTSGCL